MGMGAGVAAPPSLAGVAAPPPHPQITCPTRSPHAPPPPHTSGSPSTRPSVPHARPASRTLAQLRQ